jgi:crotonobetainyl-CoA:carnitine CoA-transferase CaiB-like acyl-CoA transferase
MLARVPDPQFGEVTLPAPVPRLSETPGRITHAAGRVGADTEPVLEALAGLSKEDIARLEAQQVIYCDRAGPKP